MFLFFLKSDLFTLYVCPSEILIVRHIPEPAFNNSLCSLGEISSDLADGVSQMCNLFYQLYKALGSSWFPSFLYYIISVPTYSVVYRQFAADSNTCEQWHSHSVPVIATFWTVLLYLQVASRAMQLQNEPPHCPVPSSSLSFSHPPSFLPHEM